MGVKWIPSAVLSSYRYRKQPKPESDDSGFFFLRHETRKTQNKTPPLSYDSDVKQNHLLHTKTKRTHHEPLHPTEPAPEHA